MKLLSPISFIILLNICVQIFIPSHDCWRVNAYYGLKVRARSLKLSKLLAGGFGKPDNFEKRQYATVDLEELCQCGSSFIYKECCSPVHEAGGSNDPIKVVRSRFSALRYGFIEHMIKTTDPSHKNYVSREKNTKYKKYYKDIQKYSTEFEFLELKFEEDLPIEFDKRYGNAYVSFTVKLQRKLEGKKPETLREKSTFKQDNKDFWLYVGGELEGNQGSY